MKVTMHLSADQLNLHTLSVRVAATHAQAAILYLENLQCPKTQKLQLMQKIHTTVNILAESSTLQHKFRSPPKEGQQN